MKAQKYNITAPTLIQIYKGLEEVFGEGNVVIIGGRAVNILCSKDYRYTEDIDVVVSTNLNPKDINKKLLENGFVPEYGEKLSEHFTKYIDRSSGVKVDLYILYNGEERAERPISGIYKEDIINSAKEVQIKKAHVKVVDPVLLVLMKYDAGREKDYIDIAKIITHVYGGFGAFEKEAKPIIESYLREAGEENKLDYTIELLKKIYEEYKDKSDVVFAMRD